MSPTPTCLSGHAPFPRVNHGTHQPFFEVPPCLSASQNTPVSRSISDMVCWPLWMPVIDRYICNVPTNFQVRQFSCNWTESKFMHNLRQSHVAAYRPRMPVSPTRVKMVRFTIPKRRATGKGASDDGMFYHINRVYLCCCGPRIAR